MIYFIGSYGLGVIAYLASDRHDVPLMRLARVCAYLMILLLLMTLVQGVGAKALVALMTFIALLASNLPLFDIRFNGSSNWIDLIRWFSHRSYCMFLIHYPFILLSNAIYEKYDLAKYDQPFMMMWVVWGASLIAANYLYQWIEKPSRQWQLR